MPPPLHHPAVSAPTADQAWQLAVMLAAGMPSRDALRYFLPHDVETATHLDHIHDSWMRSEQVAKAVLKIQGKAWQQMSAEERIRFVLEKTYNEAAYYLYTNNYAELDGPARAKADKCREILEAKVAGTSGQLTQLEQFWKDVKDGRVRLVGSANPTPLPQPPATPLN